MNHAKINDSDWSDAANVDAADAGVEFFSTPAFRRVTLISVKRVHNNLTLDATQRNAGTSVHIVNRP